MEHATASRTICVLTSDPTEAPLFRLQVQPDELNGLDRASSLMVDKLITVPRTTLPPRLSQIAPRVTCGEAAQASALVVAEERRGFSGGSRFQAGHAREALVQGEEFCVGVLL
jgi:hypothetical protein